MGKQADAMMADVQFVRGIGPKKAAVLAKYAITTVMDLLLHVPRRYLDRTSIVTIAELRRLGDSHAALSASDPKLSTIESTVVAEVRSFKVLGFGRQSRFMLVIGDATGSMQCLWFGGVQYWKNAFRIGETLAVSGAPSSFRGVLQFVHPAVDRIAPPRSEAEPADDGPPEIDWNARLNTGGLVPVYPSGQELERVGLDSAGFRRVIGTAIAQHLNTMREWLPQDILSKYAFRPLQDSFRSVHVPKADVDIREGIRRLKYDELFRFQIKLALRRRWATNDRAGIAFTVKSQLARQLVDGLPFALTKAQVRVVKEITAEMAEPHPMNRLLQGDVGSGKTIVALIAMLIAVDNGCQAIFMAPTEILAEQHFKTLARALDGMPVNVRLLVGAQRSKLRRDVLEDIRSGSAQIAVGTHALLEEGVVFAKLGLIVIDEQHRFGVAQRATLREKGENPDVLVMTATPIPRTLSLTIYGDLRVSVIDELPANRKPIKTVLRQDSEKEAVFEFVRKEIAAGRQAYFVYPLIEESEKLDLKAATVHFEELSRGVFPDLRLGLLHGRMKSAEKDEVMGMFVKGEIDILVATTVIEVGIDVPNASVMVIENAERFGLSQLHQLRGRVGRGGEQSYCVLLAKGWIAKRAGRKAASIDSTDAIDQQRLAERRLAAMVETNDGFKIAETDLRLRGPGDFFGTRQSGVPEFKVADIIVDAAVLEEARADAFALVENDPRLALAAHHALREMISTNFDEEMDRLRVG